MNAGLSRLLAPLSRRIRLTAARCVVSLVEDAKKLQSLQVAPLKDEVRDQVERFQNYGFTAHPIAGAEGVLLSLNGRRDHSVVICVDDRRYRLKALAEGEVAVYDDQGQKVHLTRNGIVIDGAGKPLVIQNVPTATVKAATKIRMETPLLECTGEIKDKCDAAGKTMSSMRSTYDDHDHNENNVLDGPTDKPNQQM